VYVCYVHVVAFHLSYEPERELPATYEIDPQRRLVTSRLWGAVTDGEVYEHNRVLRSDPHFDPTYKQLVDLSGVTEIAVTTSMINETSLDQFFEPGTRRAMFASDDAVFGMARMFALRAESVGQTIQVFRDEKLAREWLGIREEQPGS
jgi:hypothetical protein